MKVLIACEYSGRVRDAFIAMGHDALSCDLEPSDRTGPHYQGDVFEVINNGWDLMVAHPPCTYLTGAAEWAFSDNPKIKGIPRKIKPGTLVGAERRKARTDAVAFVKRLWNAPIEKIAIENPVGVLPSRLPELPKAQYVQQHWFGEDASKRTGLWLKNLPELEPTKMIDPRWVCGCGYTFMPGQYESLGKYGCPECEGEKQPRPRWANQTDSGQNREPPGADRWKIRSYTPQGLADAMAQQWR